MQMWFSIQELIGLKSLPSTDRGITKKSLRENWDKQQRLGVKGVTFEYHINSLPLEVQAELAVKLNREAIERGELPPPIKKELNYLPELIWQPFDKANDKQRQDAKARLAVVVAVAELVANGVKLMDAIRLVAERNGESSGSVKRWYYKVWSFERSDWLPLLLDKHGKNRKAAEAEFSDAAWEAFKSDYFRPERPQFGSCYERLKRAAVAQGWVIPSPSSVKRKIEREIPRVQRIYLREGENALSKYYPAMRRTVKDLEALEWVNGDGYQHNVFVEWHNGEVVRPKT